MSSPGLEDLTPELALRLFRSGDLMQQWIERRGKMPTPEENAAIFELAMQAADAEEAHAAVAYLRDDPRRTDGELLRAYTRNAPGLPQRLRDVAKLCLEDGLSLTQCARELGLSRNTVRVHMQRIRSMARYHLARRRASDQPLPDHP
jgi:DNA-directed RNA polymerase specialized sigma24 family protein